MMEILHNSKKRMPVILTREKALEWLRSDLTEKEITEIATFQYPAERMAAQAIIKDFQRATNPKEPHEYPDFKPLFC
jgi:putative SOS response-associated peptidase YedK